MIAAPGRTMCPVDGLFTARWPQRAHPATARSAGKVEAKHYLGGPAFIVGQFSFLPKVGTSSLRESTRGWGKFKRSRGCFGAARVAVRPVGFEEESFDMVACGGQIDLPHGDGSMLSAGRASPASWAKQSHPATAQRSGKVEAKHYLATLNLLRLYAGANQN
jgi:hypothetical protein